MNLVDEVDGLDFQSAPPETLTHGLVNYRLSGRGTAKASHDGSTGWEEAARVEWYEYRGPADHALFLDRWSGTCAAQAGRRIETHHIEFLPGDLVEAQANG